MKTIISILLISFSSAIYAQPGECLIAFTSEHYIVNSTMRKIEVKISKKDPKSPARLESNSYKIAPGDTMKVSNIEWAMEYKLPNIWYTFKVDSEMSSDPNDPVNWTKEEVALGLARFYFDAVEPHR